MLSYSEFYQNAVWWKNAFKSCIWVWKPSVQSLSKGSVLKCSSSISNTLCLLVLVFFLCPLRTFLLFFLSSLCLYSAPRIQSMSRCLHPSSVYFPGEILSAFRSSRTVLAPILKWLMASNKPNSSKSAPTKTSLEMRSHTIPFTALFWFWVFPWRHFSSKESSLNLWYTGLTFAITASGKPGECLKLFLSRLKPHQLEGPVGQWVWRSRRSLEAQWKKLACIAFLIPFKSPTLERIAIP